MFWQFEILHLSIKKSLLELRIDTISILKSLNMRNIHVISMYKSGFLVVILAMIASLTLVPNVNAADGYWVLDTVERNHGGATDASVIWNEVSDTAVAGKASWQHDPQACRHTIVSTFSWSATPEIVDPSNVKGYNLTVKLEQITNNDCAWGNSWLKIYYGPPTNISKPMAGMSDGPSVLFGNGNGLEGENTVPIYGPNYDERGYAIMVWSWMGTEWYLVQYKYKWIEGKMPPESANPDERVKPAPINSNSSGIPTGASTSQIDTGATPVVLPGYVASPPGAEYKITDYATCKDVVEKEPVDRTDKFSSEDARVYQWIDIIPQYRSHTAENKWYTPDGRLYYSAQSSSEDKRYDEGWKFWGWIAIKGHDAENMPGVWKVETYIDGNYVLTQRFSIAPASGQQTTLTDSQNQGFMSDYPRGNPI